MYLVTTAAIYWFFRNVVPSGAMAKWAVVAISGLSLSVAFCAAFAIRQPGPEETIRVWRQIDKRLTHVFDIIAVATIFLLFPYGDEKHRLVALAFCVGYGPMQLIVDPENAMANRISVVAILGAFSIQLWRSGNPAALILSILFVLYGGMLIFAADVFRKAVTETVQRKHESELAEARANRALAEVSQSRNAKTRFIANASHDLGQPLQAASLFARQLSAAAQGTGDRQALAGLDQALGMARAMVTHMLHFLRLESDSVQPNLSVVDVASIFGLSARLRGEEASAQGVDIRIVPSSFRITSDAALLQRAVDNLLGNAIRHSGSRKIVVGAKSAGTAMLRIWVIDSGIGIPPEEQQLVFEDYVQGRNAAAGSFGLGLSSVRRIATLLGGAAGVDGRWRNGCAAYIELPRT